MDHHFRCPRCELALRLQDIPGELPRLTIEWPDASRTRPAPPTQLDGDEPDSYQALPPDNDDVGPGAPPVDEP